MSPGVVRQAFAKYVRRHLYAQYQQQVEGLTILRAVADLIAMGPGTRPGVAAVVTLNFDSLLDRRLRERGVAYHMEFGPGCAPKDGIAVHPRAWLRPERRAYSGP